MQKASPELFDFLKIRTPKRQYEGFFRWLIGMRRHFYFFVILSLFAHLALFCMAIILSPKAEAPVSSAALRAQDFQAFREALQEYALDGKPPQRFLNALSTVSEEDFSRAYYYTPKLDDRLTEREKVGLYRMMISEAVAHFKEGEGGQSALDLPVSQYFKSLREIPVVDPSGDFSLVKIDNTLDESARLFRLSKENARAVESLRVLTKTPKERPREVMIVDSEGHYSSIPGGYYYRDSPYMEMIALGARLFYIIKGFPELPVAKTPLRNDEPVPKNAPTGLSHDERSPDFSVVYMPSYRPRAPEAHPLRQPSLVLSPDKAEQILDGLMALPVDEQVRVFSQDYLQVYDPDSPELASLTEAFIYKNLGMVFNILNDPLSRGFDLLEELYYDNHSMAELVPFALKKPESMTGAAILLCLAASYEFERRAIISLDGSLDAAKRVLADPSGSRFPVHNKEVKAYVLREVYRDIASELRIRNIASLGSVLQAYRNKQLEIYDFLMGMDGDIKCRAQYALGRLYWDEGQTNPALNMWKEISPAYSTETLLKIRNVLRIRGNPEQVIAEVSELLSVTDAANSDWLFDRIVGFRWSK
jgi:hypothetical protein